MPFDFSRLVRWVQQKAPNPGVVWRYGIAVAAVFAATSLRLALNPVLGVQEPHVPFALAVIVAAWFGGRRPGLVATALSALSLNWFFLEPRHALAIARPEEIWALSLLVATGAAIALLVGRLRESLLARARTEEALRRQAQLIDLSHDAVITTDSQRRIITWNKGAEEMYGWPGRDAIGKVLPQLLHTVSPISFTEIDEILHRERRWEGELSQTACDGRRLVVDSRHVLFGGGNGLMARILEINRNITERKQAEEALRASEARFEFVLEAARLGAWELDPASHMAWRSPPHDAIFGYPALLRKWTYEMFLDHVLPEDREEVGRKMGQAVASGANLQFECRIRRADGAVRWIWVQGRSQHDPQGRLLRLCGIVRDVTERKRNEERLRQAQKLESIGLLAGGIAHDFNNLLAVIIGNADFALHKYPSIEEIQHIMTASERAAELTRQLLEYAGKGHFVATTFNLSDLVSCSTQLLSASIPKRVELVFDLSEQELPIKADPSQIDQVLMNLVINAGEAIRPHTDGRVEIATSICEVALETVRAHAPAFGARPGRFVCLAVTDNGSGMDEATLTQIFDPFFSTKFTGRGLGLAAVQGIVRSCGGFIDVHSSSGAGSTFRVFLPAAGKKPAAEIPAGVRPGGSRRRDRGHSGILVVDDEEMVRKLACMALRSHGYEVLAAKNGKDALEVLAGAAPLPALVLLDLTMPVMGGEDLVPILNQDYPRLGIIVTSGYPEEHARRVFPPGAVAGFLEKPYTMAMLTEKVEETLNSRRSK